MDLDETREITSIQVSFQNMKIDYPKDDSMVSAIPQQQIQPDENLQVMVMLENLDITD